jgi:hypothetical protein
MTDAEFLALLDAELAARLAAGTPEEYQTAENFRFRATRLIDLYNMRNGLQKKINLAGGGGVCLIREACL